MKALLSLAILLAAGFASAGWFVDDGSYSRQREEKIAVLTPARLDALRRLISARDARQAEVTVLRRLADEKTTAIEELDERFAGEYGIRPDRNYTFDPSTLTVYLLSTDKRHGGSPKKPARLAHRVFPTEEEAQAFLALVQAKQAAADARAVFLAAAAEKEGLLRGVVDRMGREFQLDPARSYRLDPSTRSLFVQYVPPPKPREPTPEELAARAKAAAEAERKARAEAEANVARLREEARRLAEQKRRLTAEEAEAERMRQEDLRRIEKQLAELNAREEARRKEAEEKRLEAERLAKKAAEKAAKERARAAEAAKREAEKTAREAARRKEERERIEREAAEKKAREEAIRAEEAALAQRISDEKSARTIAQVRANRAFAEAERREHQAEERLETVRRRRKEAGSSANPRALELDIDLAESYLDRARRERKEARRAMEEAERALERAEEDATEAFDAEIRAKGGKPVRPSASGGFLFGLF